MVLPEVHQIVSNPDIQRDALQARQLLEIRQVVLIVLVRMNVHPFRLVREDDVLEHLLTDVRALFKGKQWVLDLDQKLFRDERPHDLLARALFL